MTRTSDEYDRRGRPRTDEVPPCRGETGLDSCHTREAIKILASGMNPFRFVPEAAETCPKCGHIRARRTR